MVNTKFQKLYDMCVKELTENIMPWWMKYSVDEENGGFYGQVDNDNNPIPKADKYITLNARLIWTFASCYRVLGDDAYLQYAKRAYDYFVKHFWDEETEGAHANLNYKGEVVDNTKFIYGNAFAIYGFSEYARATGSEEALSYAQRLAARLDKHVYDPIYKGYFEACNRDWKVNPWLHGVNRLPSDQKTMNTHLHLIEAYTCLLRSDKSMQSKVREHLNVMLNKIVDHDIHHFYYFQDRQWNPTMPDVSYGHDIEGSWLMMETVEVLGEPEAERIARDTCVNMARACYDEGIAPDGSLLSDYHAVKQEKSTAYRSWWEQNEAVVGFLNAWELTGEEKFLDASLKTMHYIDEHFVDHEKGGWFAILDANGKPTSNLKVSGPICPYHNARMCLEVIERYRKHTAK
jgi:mannobiose 2-epimerase